MARSVRIEYAGAYYHVMARGNRRGAIFLDDDDRRFFLKCVAEVCEKTGWLVHAWVLMNNHYHLFIETPEANLVEGMKWLQNTVTRRFNVRHKKWGRLFGDRYKAVLVEGDHANYYTTLWDYIHLNPYRAGLIKVSEGEEILDYPWSSVAGGYALPSGKRASWLTVERGLAMMGYKDTVKGRREMVEHLDRRGKSEGRKSGFGEFAKERDRRMSHLRRGWYWGRQEFAQWALEKASAVIGRKDKSRAYQRNPERLAHGEKEAQRLLEQGLRHAGLEEKDLKKLPANEVRKAVLAHLLWKKTTVSQTWIAEKLKMRQAANVSLILHRTNWPKIWKKLPLGLREYVKMQDYAH